jgi:hypothetical protein
MEVVTQLLTYKLKFKRRESVFLLFDSWIGHFEMTGDLQEFYIK